MVNGTTLSNHAKYSQVATFIYLRLPVASIPAIVDCLVLMYYVDSSIYRFVAKDFGIQQVRALRSIKMWQH